MQKIPYVLVVIAGVVILFGTAWSYLSGWAEPGSQTQSAADEGSAGGEAYVRSDEGLGNVELSATLLAPALLAESSILADQASAIEQGRELGIFVSLNTHSVDLSGYDLAALSSLTSAAGDLRPLRYLPENDANHHRSGILVFPAESLDLQEEDSLSLVLRDVGGVPQRILSWRLPVE